MAAEAVGAEAVRGSRVDVSGRPDGARGLKVRLMGNLGDSIE